MKLNIGNINAMLSARVYGYRKNPKTTEMRYNLRSKKLDRREKPLSKSVNKEVASLNCDNAL
jgi:hypothetical protein